MNLSRLELSNLLVGNSSNETPVGVLVEQTIKLGTKVNTVFLQSIEESDDILSVVAEFENPDIKLFYQDIRNGNMYSALTRLHDYLNRNKENGDMLSKLELTLLAVILSAVSVYLRAKDSVGGNEYVLQN